MEAIGAGILILFIAIAAFLVLFFIYSALLLLAAAWVHIEKRSFGRAMLSTLCGFFASMFVGFLLGFVPLIGWIISCFSGILISSLVTQAFFETEFIKALCAELIRMAIISVISAILIFIAFATLGFEFFRQGFSEVIQNYGSGIQILIG